MNFFQKKYKFHRTEKCIYVIMNFKSAFSGKGIAVPVHAIKACEAVEVYLHLFLTLALHGVGTFTPWPLYVRGKARTNPLDGQWKWNTLLLLQHSLHMNSTRKCPTEPYV
jgi:hypothetical protein